MSGVLFDPTSAQRIAKAVKAVERNAPPSDGAGKTTHQPYGPFWVQLSTEDPSNPGHYQWKMQTRANGTFTAVASGSTTEGVTQDTTYYSAREANSTAGLAGDYAQITFDGYDTGNSNSPLYVFTIATIPAPTAKYQVYTPIDDTLKPTWTSLRFLDS